MPYISERERMQMELGEPPLTPGQLNYLMSCHVDDYLKENSIQYRTLNDVLGVLTCMQAEIYRRIAAPLEDSKIVSNGEVFTVIQDSTVGTQKPR